MHDYREMKINYGSRVSQTVDSPIMIFDFWELSDGVIALFVILVFGVLFYSWLFMLALLVLILGVGPIVKRKNHKGVFLHWPYRHLSISLPGLVNPGGKRKFSD